MGYRLNSYRCPHGHTAELLADRDTGKVDSLCHCGGELAQVSSYEAAGAPKVRAWRGVGKSERF